MKAIWAFWKKKTGNYLANKFFEDSEFFNAYRIYAALQDIDPSLLGKFQCSIKLHLPGKLGNYVQAMESYAAIEEFANSEGVRKTLPTVSTWSLYLVWQNGEESNWKTPELFVKQSIATNLHPPFQ